MKKFLLLVLLSLGGLLHAQEPTPIRVSFKTVGLGLSLDNIFIKQPKGYTALVVESESIARQSIIYTGAATLPILRKVKTADKTTYEPAGQITFPQVPAGETGNYLVLFQPGSNGPKITVVPNDTTSFPRQTIRVINVLPAPAGVMVNKSTELLTPGQIRLFSVRGTKDDRVEIHIAVQHRNKWIEVNNNVYSCNKDTRQTVFLINNTPAGAPATQLPSIGFISLPDQPDDKTPPPTEDLGI